MKLKQMKFNCHNHRDELFVSFENTIYHKTEGVLCWGESIGRTVVYHPIRFKDKAAARKWIESGCIADIQEGLTHLDVGFRTQQIADRF